MHPNLTSQEKVSSRYPKSKLKNVLYWLAFFADHEDGSGCWCSVKSVADKASISERTAQRHLHELEKRGDLIIHYQGSGFRTNLYSIPLCKDISKTQSKLPLVMRDHTESYVSDGCKKVVTPVENFDKIVTLRGGIKLKVRVTNCHPTLADLNILKSEKGRVTDLSTPIHLENDFTTSNVHSENDSMAFKENSDDEAGSDRILAICPETERELESLTSAMRVTRAGLRSDRRTTLTPSGQIFDVSTQS
jgi:hypothetical protein